MKRMTFTAKLTLKQRYFQW